MRNRNRSRDGDSSPQQSPDTTCITPKTSPPNKRNQKSPDLITCGDCATSFPLDNIIDFITHKRLHALQEQLAASVEAQQNQRSKEPGEEICQTPVRKKQQRGMTTKRVKRLKDTESHQRKLKKN